MIVRLQTTEGDAALAELERMAEQLFSGAGPWRLGVLSQALLS